MSKKKTVLKKVGTTRAGLVVAKAPKAKKKSVAKVTISKTKAIALIKANGPNKIMSFTVATTKDPNRKLTGSINPPLAKRGSSKAKTEVNLTDQGMLRIWDKVEHGYKTVNLQNLKGLRVGGGNYIVR